MILIFAVLIRIFLLPFQGHSDMDFIARTPWVTGEWSRYYPALEANLAQFLGGYPKLNYLIAEIGVVGLIALLYKDRFKTAAFLWLFSPIVIYNAYLFGQYRMYTALVTWLMILALRKGHKGAFGFFLGSLALLDTFAFLIMIPAVFIVGCCWRERLKIAWAISVPIAVMLSVVGPDMFSGYLAPIVVKMVTQSIIFSYAEGVGIALKVILVTFYVWHLGRVVRAGYSEDYADRFIDSTLTVLFILYATCIVHVHYFMWSLPFLIDAMLRGRVSQSFIWSASVLVLLFNAGHPTHTIGLIFPHAEGWVVPGKAIAVTRIVFSGLAGWFVWALCERRVRVEKIK